MRRNRLPMTDQWGLKEQHECAALIAKKYRDGIEADLATVPSHSRHLVRQIVGATLATKPIPDPRND